MVLKLVRKDRDEASFLRLVNRQDHRIIYKLSFMFTLDDNL